MGACVIKVSLAKRRTSIVLLPGRHTGINVDVARSAFPRRGLFFADADTQFLHTFRPSGLFFFKLSVLAARKEVRQIKPFPFAETDVY